MTVNVKVRIVANDQKKSDGAPDFRVPGGKVKVTVEIEAEVPEGVSDDVQRVINENCQTLRFKSHGFEES